HFNPYATASIPADAPVVSAISSDFAPIIRATPARIRLGKSKNVVSGLVWGNFFASIAAWMVFSAIFGMGACDPRFRYVAASNSNPSCRQSVFIAFTFADAVAIAVTSSALHQPLRCANSQQGTNWNYRGRALEMRP